MRRNTVELRDGSRRSLRSLRRQVPHLVFTGRTHLEVCERLAAARELPVDLAAVYENYLFTKSDRAREITALVELISAGQLQVRALRARNLGADFSDLLGEGVRIETRGRLSRNLINRRQLAVFGAKLLLHRLYRALGRGPKPREALVRAWVENTDSVYPEIVEQATLFVYPYRASLRRQLSYVRRCRERQRDFRLMGLPYRLLDLAGMLLRWRRRDAWLVGCEARAFRRHADELVTMGVRSVYTTDEFEMAGVELHGALRKHGVHCTNACHGIATYGPRVSYTEFWLYNAVQRDYYRLRGEIGEYRIMQAPGVTRTDAQAAGPAGAYDPVVVYLLGNWRHAGKRYEADFEQRALVAAREACAKLGLPLVLKAHPNLADHKAARLQRRHDAPVLREIDPLRTRHPIFLNVLSTAYYAFLELGPMLFLSDALLAPERLFGDGIPSVGLPELADRLADFHTSEHWLASRRAQLEREAGARVP